MKQIYFLLIAFCVFTSTNAQIVSIPDANFKAKLLAANSTNSIAKDINANAVKIDTNNDNEIQISEALSISFLSVESSNINDLTGILNFKNLVRLYCPGNKINVLNLNNLRNLVYLHCDNNQLTILDLSNLNSIEFLFCRNNNLKTLDISKLFKLKSFYCDNNQITTLDLSKLLNLTAKSWSLNPLESLFLKNGIRNDSDNFSNIPTLKYICVDDNELESIQKQTTEYGYSNCVINSYCSFVSGGTFYTIKGNQKYDSNSDGCDANDALMPNLKFSITNGTTVANLISDGSGNYSIPVQAGTYSITPILENPSYFIVSPTRINVTFPSQTSPFVQNFCIKPKLNPDLSVIILPLTSARPGFDVKYKLIYKNKGNTTQSGSVNLIFMDAVLDLVVANPITTNQSTNNLSWNFTTLKPFETREIIFTMNVNSPMEIPPVINGANLNFITSITSSATDETPIDNTFEFNQTVLGSYDPNDKTCLEGAVITPALIGQYVHYMIRFENTGTFAATNVVVKDMIDLTKFDISTLLPTSASHSYVTNITAGNKVEFIFENINLPFDDANNDGYIVFKIKTLPTLVVNDTFTNEANIYFDYNFPILTNKATSTFKTLGTQDFDFASYFTVYPNPAKTELNITAKETIEIKSISIYNALGQLVLVVTNAEKVSKIDVSSLTAGNYFIKINSDKGTSNARFVKE
ncbi:T9SS type A sorting domain-containing protein [Flavobacterium sp.]|uniref:T9SS type A sorting domain-containing protein n=1 Tax=Flavobacterium sp. TaxID=239 RepID=UPI00286AD54D|nr:T9SS type A sorting domain-containing protein [Flavobacterium sp.]